MHIATVPAFIILLGAPPNNNQLQAPAPITTPQQTISKAARYEYKKQNERLPKQIKHNNKSKKYTIRQP